MLFDADITLDELLKRHPASVGVFMRRKMLCVGCPCNGFHTIKDAALYYGIKQEALMDALKAAICQQDETTRPLSKGA